MTRCRAAWFLAPHDLLLRQKRDAAGRLVVPHTLEWECQRCGRLVGETQLHAARGPASSTSAIHARRHADITR